MTGVQTCALPICILGLRLKSVKTRVTGFGVLAVSVVMLLALLAWTPPGKYILLLNLRFLTCLFNVAAVFVLAALCRRYIERDPGERSLAAILTSIGAVLLLVILSVEAHNFSSHLIANNQSSRWLARMSVSVVWGMYAFVALTLGFRKHCAALRYAALALFGITVAKVIMLETSQIKEIYRWIVLYATGFMLIGGSYLYYRLEKSIGLSSAEDSE